MPNALFHVVSPRLTLLSCAVILFGTQRLAAATPQLAPRQRARIASGEVLTMSLAAPSGSKIKPGKAIGLVEGSPEEVLYTLLDIARYRYFVPLVKGSRLVKRRKGAIYGVIETRLPWPVKDAWAYLKVTYGSADRTSYTASWKMINGTLKRYVAAALIEPWKTRSHMSVLTYQVIAEPKTAAPDALLTKGMRHAAEMALHRIRLRVKALRKFKKMPGDPLSKLP